MTDILNPTARDLARERKRQDFAIALDAARELTSMLPSTYMAYLNAVATRSHIDVEVCHLVIRELELDGTLRWNQALARMYPASR